MAKPIIHQDVETLDMSTLASPGNFEALESHRRELLEKSYSQVASVVDTEIDARIDYFRHATDDEQVALIAEVNGKVLAYEYFLGMLLDIIDESIMTGKKNGYKSTNTWLDTNIESTGVSKAKAYYCLSIYRSMDYDTFKSIGIKKARVISSIKDTEVRTKILNVAKKSPEISVIQLEEKADKLYQSLIVEPKEKEKAAAKKIVLKSHPYSVKSASRTRDGKIIVSVDPEDHEAMLSFLTNKEFEIKKYLESYRVLVD